MIVNYRSSNQRRRVTDDACKEACNRLFQRFKTLAARIENKIIASLRPDELLPADVFLDEMLRRVNAPQVVFTPMRLKNKIWTESFHAYVYAQIEQAFWKAGQLRGGNRSGFIEELKELRSWVVELEKDPSQNHTEFFTQKTAFLFKKGILEDRGQRVELQNWLSSNTSTASTIRVDGTQPWVGKAPSLSNEKWPKRALEAALKRDRSTADLIPTHAAH